MRKKNLGNNNANGRLHEIVVVVRKLILSIVQARPQAFDLFLPKHGMTPSEYYV